MQINGEWYLCDDDVERPVIRGEVLTSRGSWEPTRFLVDTGADRTVFSAELLAALGFSPSPGRDRLGGLGGLVEPVLVETTLRLTRENDGKATFHSQFAAVTALEA